MAYNYFPQYDPMSEFGLAHQTNQFMGGQSNIAMANALPGYATNIKQSGANIGNMLKGVIPPDVLRLMQQQSGERGIATGMPGSMNNNAAYMQALGLTSLGLMGQGEQQLTQSMERAPMPQLYNPASSYVPRQNAYDELRATQMGMNRNQTSGQNMSGWGAGLPVNFFRNQFM